LFNQKKIIVVLPAYNAASTLRQTYAEIPMDIVDEVILCDDASKDNTLEVARELNIQHIISHDKNKGYGGNQKSLYDKALDLNGDIVVMLHPDYQYTPLLLPAMISMISSGLYDCVLASRILGKGALEGGMPLYKYVANRFLTFVQNILVGHKLSEYHTGYRAFSAEVLRGIKYENNSNDFVFDNQMLSQIIYNDYRMSEISCPTKYFEEASSINFSRSVTYGLGVLSVSVKHRLCKWGLMSSKIY